MRSLRPELLDRQQNQSALAIPIIAAHREHLEKTVKVVKMAPQASQEVLANQEQSELLLNHQSATHLTVVLVLQESVDLLVLQDHLVILDKRDHRALLAQRLIQASPDNPVRQALMVRTEHPACREALDLPGRKV